MKIVVEYQAQLKVAAGTGQETIEFDQPPQLTDVLKQLGETHGEALSALLFNSAHQIQPSLLLFLDDQQVRSNSEVLVQEAQTLTLLSPVSGG